MTIRAARLLHAFALLAALVTAAAPVFAVEPSEVLSDPALESRARAISKELRCLVCQNESIDDSDATLAHDLRVLVRERLKAGDSDQQVLDFMVARYGEFVLLKPPLSWHTVILWGLPPVALIAGIIMLFLAARRGTQSRAATKLTPDEEARVAALLKREGL
jgi:cytochrome c-type biogenesis protein CcmH